MGELSDVINEETPTYTFGGLMADIGGAMGLLLGLRKGSTIIFSYRMPSLSTKVHK